jgi:glycosyltransferase involved in cell wall biosynthesis
VRVPSHSRVRVPLTWCGALEDPSGYADEARAYLVALDREGYDASARSLRWTEVQAGLSDRHLAVLRAALARTVDEPAALVYHLVPGAKLPTNPNGPTVLRTMFETSSVPTAWLPRLAEADEVWVPCTFNRGTFVHGGFPAERLHVLPETLDFDLFAPSGAPRPERPFTFLTNFDFTDRKGWDLLLDAWAEAFDPADDVRLVLKCISIHGTSEAEIAARVHAHLRGRETAPIELNSRLLRSADMPRLYESADAFVLPSRGEGWGRPYMEAMAMGLPTIGSRWSGNLDFMHDGNSWLVDGTVVPVRAEAQRHTQIYAGHEWFEPDFDALVRTLREVAAGGPEVKSRAAGARAELIERFGPAPTVERIVALVDGALARWRERRSRSLAVAWRGDWCSVHSLAVVNEALTGALEASGSTAVARRAVDGDAVADDRVGVAQQWPPSFEPPSDGPFVLYQPWEFGEVPQAWVEPIRTRVDEVWTPSEYARQAYLAAGIAPDLVHVVPNGVNLDRFRPDGPAHPLPTQRGTVFLFVGGTTHRKGIDVLLEAYGRAFGADDDVCLILKGFGSTTLYRGQTAEAQIELFRSRPGTPELHLIDEELAYEDIPALYRAADCVVQAYRGEGFCLPALEALACGVPVIVTAGGPTDDFTSPDCAWYVDATRRPLGPNALTPAQQPRGGGWMLEPDVDGLVRALRAAADPQARAAKAGSARAHAERYSWAEGAERARRRLAALTGRFPIRRVSAATVAERRRVLLAVDADWDDATTWAPALHAYVEAFGARDEVTLLLAGDEATKAPLVEHELLASGADLELAPDIVLADPSGFGVDALALTADGFICVGDRRPARARRTVPAEPAALKSFVLETT